MVNQVTSRRSSALNASRAIAIDSIPWSLDDLNIFTVDKRVEFLKSMSTNVLNRLPTVRVFEDNRSAPPKQITFPRRRHSSNIRKTKSTTPSTRWKQQTLTQITPALIHASSNHGSFDGADYLEYDSLDLAMPPKKRPRKSGTPKPKRKLQDQTITQMDPFKQQLYPSEGLEALTDENILVQATVPRRKKTRTASNTPTASTVQTRASKRKSAGSCVKKEAILPSGPPKPVVSEADPEPPTTLLDSQDLQMPPPETPKRPRRKIVPSSQSPAETPISTHGRGNRENQNVTPLGERSLNTPSKSRLFSRRKSVQWAPKLVVADSTNGESENGEALFPPIYRNHPSEKKPLWNTSPEPQSSRNQPPPRTPSSVESFVNKAVRLPNTYLRQSSQRALKRKATVADSEDDDNNSPTASPEKANYNPPPSSKDETDKSSPCAIINRHVEDSQSSAPPSQSIQQEIVHETVPTQLIHPRFETAHSPVTHSSTQDRKTLHKQSFDSEKASAQLESELLQSSSPASVPQPPALETESQFENAWRELTPPPLDLEYEQNTNEQDLDFALPTIPPLSPKNSITKPTSLPPIPSSQATTTDITQATPHHSRLNDESQILGSSPTQHPEHFLPSSSSPFRARKEQDARTTFMGYEGWNGVPMRESQLMPRSWMDDSLELPPTLGEEVELEMEEEV